MIRLFTALPLPEDLRLRLAGLGGGIEGARWVAPENLHITLRFIGEVPEDRAEDIVEALDGVGGGSFPVTLDGTGHFGTGNNARAVWVGVRRTPEIAALHERIDRALVGAGLEPEKRKYTPHVTLARLRGARTGRVRNWLEANGDFLSLPFEADRFVLFESRMGRGGSAYLPVAEFPLS